MTKPNPPAFPSKNRKPKKIPMKGVTTIHGSTVELGKIQQGYVMRFTNHEGAKKIVTTLALTDAAMFGLFTLYKDALLAARKEGK